MNPTSNGDNDLRLPGDYPPGEDIYRKLHKESEIDPEDPTHLKRSLEGDDDLAIDELDVPGAELDDDLEAIGSEDEENNYYSLGGDNHLDLEENLGDDD